MEAAMNLHNMTKAAEQTDTAAKEGTMTILEATPGQTYTIKEINTEDEEMNGFLFRLGCYSGEPITIVTKGKKSCVVVIKDGRYNLDRLLSEAVVI